MLSPMAIEQGILLVLELALEIFKAVQARDTVGDTLKRVKHVIDQKLVIDADVDEAARGGK